MAIAFVQHVASGSGTGTSISASVLANTNVGDDLILAAGPNAPISVTDSKGNVWFYDTPYAQAPVIFRTHLTAQLTTSDTITVHFANSNFVEFQVHEFSTASGNQLMFDQFAYATGTGTALNSGKSGTTSVPTELVIGVGSTGSAVSLSAGTGYSLLSSAGQLAVESGAVTVQAPFAASMSSGSSVAWGCIVATYFEAAAPTLTTFTYDTVNHLQVDRYEPAGFAGGPAPAVLLIHGGSFDSGDKSWCAPMAQRLANAGILCYSVNYRLAPNYWPIPDDDIANCIAWMKARPEVDSSGIYTLGFSAGARLAAYAAMTVADIAGCVTWSGNYDLAASYDEGYTSNNLMGPEPRSDWVLASPVMYMTAQSPPVFILHARSDATVPYQAAQIAAERARDVGQPYWTASFNTADHAAAMYPYAMGPTIAWLTQLIDYGLRPGVVVTKMNTSGVSYTGSPVSVAVATPPTLKNHLVMVVDSDQTLSSITDPEGNVWTIHGHIGTTSYATIASCRIDTEYTTSDSLTLTFAAATTYAVPRIMEVTGLDQSAWFDLYQGQGGSSATPTTGTSSTTAARGEVVIGTVWTASAVTKIAPGTGQTLYSFTSWGTGDTGDLWYQTNQTGTQTLSATLSASVSWQSILGAFKTAQWPTSAAIVPPTTEPNVVLGTLVHEFLSPWGNDAPGIVDSLQLTDQAPGGYQAATGNLPWSYVLDHPEVYQFGTTWRITHAESGQLVWAGYLLDPAPSGNVAQLVAKGWGILPTRTAGVRLYQDRYYGDWSDMSSDPYGYTGIASYITADVNSTNGRVNFHTSNGTTTAVGDKAGVTFWAPGNPITRVAFSYATDLSDANWDILIRTATGPSGTLTTKQTISTFGSTGTYDTDSNGGISGSGDLVVIELYNSVTTTSGNRHFRITDLRVNGIAIGDSWTTDQIVADIAGFLGIQTTLVTSATDVGVPLYIQQGSYAEALTYMAAISDYYWRVVDLGNGPVMDYGPWGQTTWTLVDPEMPVDLQALDRYNEVTVPFSYSNSSATGTITITADPNPAVFSANGITNNYSDFASIQAMPDATTATNVATNIVNYLSGLRYGGTVTLSRVKDANGSMRSAYHVQAGDSLKIPTLGVTLRISSTTKTDTSVQVSFAQDYPQVDQFINKTQQRISLGGTQQA